MKSLKYTIVKTEKQYYKYCDILEELIMNDKKDVQDEVELLSLLIEKWDADHNSFLDLGPIQLLKTLMEENSLRAKDISQILGLSKSTVSKILNYHKGLSKETIRKLSAYFKLSQDTFNRPYPLTNQASQHYHSTNPVSTNKDVGKFMFVLTDSHIEKKSKIPHTPKSLDSPQPKTQTLGKGSKSFQPKTRTPSVSQTPKIKER